MAYDKAALVLIALGEELAATILQRIPESQRLPLLKEVSKLKSVPKSELEAACAEVLRELEGSRPSTDSAAMLKLLERSHPGVMAPDFGFLGAYSVKYLAQAFLSEGAQLKAVLLAVLPQERAAALLKEMSARDRQEVLPRLAGLQLDREALAEFARFCQESLRPEVEGVRVGGAEFVAKALQNLDSAELESELASLERRSPQLGAEVRALLFRFEDLVSFEESLWPSLAAKFGMRDWALALRISSSDLRECVYSQFSQRSQQLLRDEEEVLPKKVLREDVLAVQRRIIAQALELRS